MYYLHYDQLKLLTTCFGLTQKQFSIKCFDGKEHMWPQRMCKLDNILVTDIVSICNACHIPFSAFVNSYKTPLLVRDKSIVMDNNFQPISIIKEHIMSLYLGEDKRVTKELICKELNVSLSTFYCWFNYPKRFAMKAHHLVTLCNKFNLSPSIIINDPNNPDDDYKPNSGKLERLKEQLEQQIVQMDGVMKQSKDLLNELKNLLN